MCQRATAKANGYCNQILRATVDVEVVRGPDYYMQQGPAAGGFIPSQYWGRSYSGNTRVVMSRWPILEVSQVAVAVNGSWPRTFTTLPTNWAEPENPPIGIYGSSAPGPEGQGSQAILIGPGYINWWYGRNGYMAEITYTNGWPHCNLTSAVTAGSMTIPVNDVTGWAITNYQNTATGATGTIRDAQGNQEVIHCDTSTATAGPGNLVLTAPLVWDHQTATIVTTMPGQVEQACILFATAEALTRGATSTTIHDIGGHAQHTGGDVAGLNAEAELLLIPFKRTI
jgi:hypothetical protein